MKTSNRVFAEEIIVYYEVSKSELDRLKNGEDILIAPTNRGIKYKLVPIGEGTTCVAYACKSSDIKYIVKEFYPYDEGVLLVSREEHECNNRLKLWDDNSTERLKNRFKSFVASAEIIDAIDDKYQKYGGTARIAPRLFATSLGYCLLCNYNGGKSLSECVADVQKLPKLKDKLSLALHIIYKALSDLNVYHTELNEYVNFDIKSENLFFCRDDGKFQLSNNNGSEIYDYSCIRNLDFSSCKKMSDLIKELEKIENDIKFEEYIANNMASTERYYSSCEIRAALNFCRSKAVEKEKKNCLKRLDILAIMKVFVQVFLPDEFFEDNQELYFALKYVFENGLTEQDNFYECYYILNRLKEMLDKIISDETPTAYELMCQIAEIKSALDGTIYIKSDKTDEQKNAIILCKESFGKKNDALLKTYKNEIFGEEEPSFAGLLSFCNENGICSPAELNRYLLFNC